MAEKTLNLKITGMTCDHCAESVLTAASAVPGAVAVDVSVARGTATIQYDDARAQPQDFIIVIDAEGYGATVA